MSAADTDGDTDDAEEWTGTCGTHGETWTVESDTMPSHCPLCGRGLA